MIINEKLLTESRIGKNASNAINHHLFPRFRWYGYKEGFSSKLVEEAIANVGVGPGEYILDPFNGSGTVTLTASLNGINSIGIEVNPFVAFMAATKMENCPIDEFMVGFDDVLSRARSGEKSPLNGFSTFSEQGAHQKWLFNNGVLNSFEGSWQSASEFPESKKRIYRLSMIAAAMDNCNATKDGKCLKYRHNWESRGFNETSYSKSLEDKLLICKEDLESTPILRKAKVINGDARNVIKSLPQKFKLCITSPPYLNSFDYTDIYRPELFLGKFIHTNQELKELRYKTIRSHVEVVLPKPNNDSYGDIYYSIYKKISESNNMWSKQIPVMIQSYFEDMENVLSQLFSKAKIGGELWLVVANSVYVGVEIPVDLILAEIGTRNKWELKRIEVLRYINRRKSKYNGNIKRVRESLIVFKKTTSR